MRLFIEVITPSFSTMFLMDCQRRFGKATENHLFRQILRPLADRLNSDLCRFLRRETIYPGADSRKCNRTAVCLVCERKSIEVTRLQQLRFAMSAAVPNRIECMNEKFCVAYGQTDNRPFSARKKAQSIYDFVDPYERFSFTLFDESTFYFTVSI